MKKVSILILVFISTFTIIKADIVTETTAAIVAQNHYYSHASAIDPVNIRFELAYTEMHNDNPVYYIYNFGPDQGFVMVAAEDNVYPILGYAFEGTYTNNPGFDATNFNYWMNNYADQIIYTREQALKADKHISNTWKELLASDVAQRDSKDVNPLLSTLWDQGTYYNALCPADGGGPGGHVWAGCVATAMTQVMKYYNYPEQGVGSHSYNCPGYGNQSANFGATTYEWASMPNQLYSQNNAVATLLYHFGVSVEMQYSTSGSGAFSSDARDAIVNYFSYSSTAQLMPKSSFPIETFIYKLKNELNLQRPVYYDGYGGSGGHAFVCDGYQGDAYFHFNWGWSGYANGYFYLNNLNPGGYQFNEGQSAMFYVMPEGTNTLNGVENFTAETIDENVEMSWDPVSAKDLLGYNIYKNNLLIEFTSNTEYIDESVEQGSYTYYVCALYDEGESYPSEAVSIFIGGGTIIVYEDDFEAYSSGGQLACQNDEDWTTWSNNPCSGEDPYISSDIVFEGSNSVIVEGTNDAVKLIDNYTEGLYKISFQMYVPDGFLGYFNTLQEFAGTNSKWGMQVFFEEDGQASMDAGGEGAATFSFPQDTWMYNEVIIDMNNDWAEYLIDGESIHGWQWSIGAFGQNDDNQLGGVNFYAWTGADKGTPKYYFDNFLIEEFGSSLAPPLNFTVNVAVNIIQLSWDSPNAKDLLSYNIYYAFEDDDFELLANTTETSYVIESPGYGLHSYYLTAVYDEGESDPTNIEQVLITGNNELKSNTLKIYPNPADDYLLLQSDQLVISIKIYNNLSSLVLEDVFNSKSNRIDISQLEKGFYYIIIQSGEKIIKKQIIKK